MSISLETCIQHANRLEFRIGKSAKHNIVCLLNDNFDEKFNKEAHRYIKAWLIMDHDSWLFRHKITSTEYVNNTPELCHDMLCDMSPTSAALMNHWKFSVEEATDGDCSNKYGTCHRRQSFIHSCEAEKTFIKKGNGHWLTVERVPQWNFHWPKPDCLYVKSF